MKSHATPHQSSALERSKRLCLEQIRQMRSNFARLEKKRMWEARRKGEQFPLGELIGGPLRGMKWVVNGAYMDGSLFGIVAVTEQGPLQALYRVQRKAKQAVFYGYS